MTVKNFTSCIYFIFFLFFQSMLFFVVSMKVDFFLPNKNKFQKENDFETTRAHCCKQING